MKSFHGFFLYPAAFASANVVPALLALAPNAGALAVVSYARLATGRLQKPPRCAAMARYERSRRSPQVRRPRADTVEHGRNRAGDAGARRSADGRDFARACALKTR